MLAISSSGYLVMNDVPLKTPEVVTLPKLDFKRYPVVTALAWVISLNMTFFGRISLINEASLAPEISLVL